MKNRDVVQCQDETGNLNVKIERRITGNYDSSSSLQLYPNYNNRDVCQVNTRYDLKKSRKQPSTGLQRFNSTSPLKDAYTTQDVKDVYAIKLGDQKHTKTLYNLDLLEGACLESGAELSVIGKNKAMVYARL